MYILLDIHSLCKFYIWKKLIIIKQAFAFLQPLKIRSLKKMNSPLFKERRKWQPTPVLLPGKLHGWRSLVGCSQWDHRVGHDSNFTRTPKARSWLPLDCSPRAFPLVWDRSVIFCCRKTSMLSMKICWVLRCFPSNRDLDNPEDFQQSLIMTLKSDHSVHISACGFSLWATVCHTRYPLYTQLCVNTLWGREAINVKIHCCVWPFTNTHIYWRKQKC